jgi:hypothetical protein
MKAQTKILGLFLSAAFVASVHAESTVNKEAMRIDFNRMIDANANDKSDLEKRLAEKSQRKRSQEIAVQSDKQKVIDFVDVEINLSKERPIVDRRFNSVDEPHMAPEFEVQESTQN